MLWTLLKIVIFLAIIAGAVFGLTELTTMGEIAVLQVAGREFVLDPQLAGILALVLLLAAWLLFRTVGLLVATLRFLNGDETAISRYMDRRSERKGYESLADGMMALAAGEGRLAIRKAERAAKYLKRPALTKLVIAQGAEMVGDKKLATDTFKALIQDDRTRFVGVRGLMKQKLLDGDTDTALKLAEKALAIRPKNAEVQTTLLQLQAQNEDWAGARSTLAAALKSGNLPRDVHKRRDAVLALANARDAMAMGKVADATRDANTANQLSPTLVPGAAMAARLAISENNTAVAARIIRKAWDAEPHPDLAAAFADIAPNETAKQRLKRFRPLISKHAKHPEAKLLEAELQIAAEDFVAARKALGDLAETEPTARSLTIMAAIERGAGSEDRVVRAWLAKAVTAARGPQWVCGKCGHVHADWRPICTHCDSFDTLTWENVEQSDAALSGPGQMLPLIVGALEDKREAPDDDPDDPLLTDAEVVLDAEESGPDQSAAPFGSGAEDEASVPEKRA